MLGISFIPTTTMPGSTKTDISNSETFANTLAGLKLNSSFLINSNLNGHLASLGPESGNNPSLTDGAKSQQIIALTNNYNVTQQKSKFKTIKIFVASNKDEFHFETQCLLQETQPELQQFFMQHGYDFSFVNVNLNCNFDPFIDPYMFECLNKELDECFRVSEACFFLALIGNKYGVTPLPLEISKNEYDNIKKTASTSDFEFFLSWYYQDENNVSVCYKLKSLTESFPNLYYKESKNEDHTSDMAKLKEIHQKLTNILFTSTYNEKNDAKTLIRSSFRSGKNQLLNDRFMYSGLELLTNVAFKNSPNECLAIGRNVENIEPNKKNSEKYVDLTASGKIDKSKDEKQFKFKEAVMQKLNDENKHHFYIKWKEDYEDLAELNTKSTNNSTSESENEVSSSQVNASNPIKNSLPSSLNKYDTEFRLYLQNFNAVIVSKIKILVEKHLQEQAHLTHKPSETAIYEEATRHLYKFQNLIQENLIDSNDYVERLKRLVSAGIKSEHYPIFLYGGPISGKTSTLARYGIIAYKMIDPCMVVVRFSHLTNQSSNFETLLYSIYEQLSIFLKQTPEQELKNKSVGQLVERFHLLCEQISTRSKNQLLIIIDGLQDIIVDKAHVNILASQVKSDQISWLFERQLPARVHMIVSVCRSTVENINSGGVGGIVPLFSRLYSEKLSSATENFLFEMPIPLRKSDTSEIVTFITTELARVDRQLKEEQVQDLIVNLFGSKQQEQRQRISTRTSDNSEDQQSVGIGVGGGGGIEDKGSFFYFFLMLKDVANAKKTNNSLEPMLGIDSFPKDLDSYLSLKLDLIEKKFNVEMLKCLFGYITAARNGITEVELLDLLSCNNDFFTQYYSEAEELPVILRFPVFQWLLVKYQLGDLLTQRFMDNKVTFSWNHDCVKKFMRQRYFSKLERLKTCHKDLANYFLEAFVETKPLVDMNRNMQIRDEESRRYVAQQPLVYSEMRYNFRRLSELWYNLMFSGDFERLKEHTFFNFEYLLSKCHSTPLRMLLEDLEVVLRQKLDVDMLLMSSLLKKCYATLCEDPLRLASEVVSRLRPLREEYGEHVASLVEQTQQWIEQYDSPVLLPLSSWLDSPETMLVSKIHHTETTMHKIAVTSFNQHIFFSTPKHEIVMYHIPSKKFRVKFTGHTNIINSLQISYDNRFLISVSSDKLVKVWNLTTGGEENTFNMHKAAILCSVLTHNNEQLITGTDNRLINVIQIETGEVVHSIDRHFDAVVALAISLDDLILVSASLDHSIKRWSLPDMEQVDSISSVYSPITSMIITSDNTFIIIACENHSVQVKSLITGADIHDLNGHNSAVTCLAPSSDDERVYVACEDGKLYMYDIKSRELIMVVSEQEASISDVRISSDGNFLFSSSGNYLYVLNMKKKNFLSNKKKDPLYDESKLIKAMSISKEGDMAITGDESGLVNLWNVQDGELMEAIIEPQDADHKVGVTCVAFSNSYLFSVIAFANNTINVYDNELGEVVADFMEHHMPIKHLYIIDNNRKILSSDGINLCKIWMSHTGQLLESITVACNILGLSPDNKYVVSGAGENTVKIWGLNDAKVIRSIDHPSKITVITFTHDSQYVITGGEDNSCKIWELATGKLNQVLIEHDGAITSIAVPLNNNFVVSGSTDKIVILWNFKDGSCKHKLVGHQEIIVKVAIASDGGVVISASKDGIINVWSARHGSLFTSLNVQFTLADLLVSSDCSHMIVRLENVTKIPIISLVHKRIKETTFRTLSQSTLKSSDDIHGTDTTNQVLPIKPKPLLYQKVSNMSKLHSVEFATSGMLTMKSRRFSEAMSRDRLGDNQFEGISSSQTGLRSMLNKARRKTKKSTDFSSTASIVHVEENKPKKTKICCLL